MLGLVLSPQQRHVFTGGGGGLNTVATEIRYLFYCSENFNLGHTEKKEQIVRSLLLLTHLSKFK